MSTPADNTDNIDQIAFDLLKKSNEYSDNKQYADSIETALQALNLNPSENLKAALHEKISIFGFYSTPEHKLYGKQSCEWLSLRKRLPWSQRNQARQNSAWYASSASELMPSTQVQMVNFKPANNYKPTNPSITAHNGKLYMNQRTVNYTIRPDGSYDMNGDNAIITKNWLLELADDLSVISANEIMFPADMPAPKYNLVLGFEDSRLFFLNDQPYCTSTVREMNDGGWCEIVLSKISKDTNGRYFYSDYKPIIPTFTNKQNEKNWMPLVLDNTLYFIYSHEPTRIINTDGDVISSQPSVVSFDNFRGGGQVISFDSGFLSIIHESHNIVGTARRQYMHRFVWYDSQGVIRKYSQAFYIHKLGIEFAAGLTQHPSTGKIIVSFGVDDKESWLATFDPKEIVSILQNSEIHADVFDSALVNEKIQGQYNKPLSNRSIVDQFVSLTKSTNLPIHPDVPKNWDNYLAVYLALTTTSTNDNILDAGSSKLSSFLPCLRSQGYTNLVGIDLLQKTTEYVNDICYQYGDITQTDFDDGHFSFVACLSVLEHGVDDEKFLKEMSRIIKLNGHLAVSVDYWETPIDTQNKTAFDVPVQIYSAADVNHFVLLAQKYGFEPISPVSTQCEDRVVDWIGLQYTFMNLCFKKVKTYDKKSIPLTTVKLSKNPQLNMLVKSGDWISDALLRSGVWEENLTNRLQNIASTSGGILVDVGANMGYFSLLWAKAKQNNISYAFEPVFENIDILVQNIKNNRLENQINVLSLAAGYANQMVKFLNGPAHETGHGGITIENNPSSYLVPMIKLDDYFDHIDVLKIDTEGADFYVLKGASKLLESKKIKTVFFEVNVPRSEKLGLTGTGCLHLLESYGYTVEVMTYNNADLIEYVATPK